MDDRQDILFQRIDKVDWGGDWPTRQINALIRADATHVVDLLLIDERAGTTMSSSRICYVRDRPNGRLRQPKYKKRHGDIQRTKQLSRVRVRGMAPEGHLQMLEYLRRQFGLDVKQIRLVHFPWDELV